MKKACDLSLDVPNHGRFLPPASFIFRITIWIESTQARNPQPPNLRSFPIPIPTWTR